MKLVIGYAILLVACSAAAQTSQEFHSRYGDSDTERFKIREGIGLTVQYGSDGSACQMEIKPQTLIVQRSQQKLMAPEVVDGILDEVVPPDRGRKVDNLYQSAGCGASQTDFYENLTISRSTDHCLPLKPERDSSVTIVFKRQACPDTGLQQPAGPDALLFKTGLRAWKEERLSDAQMIFQSLVNTYPDSQYAGRAKVLLKNLKNR
jgi:hypothetical protein